MHTRAAADPEQANGCDVSRRVLMLMDFEFTGALGMR